VRAATIGAARRAGTASKRGSASAAAARVAGSNPAGRVRTVTIGGAAASTDRAEYEHAGDRRRVHD
jgi:hypothetical protein